MFKLLSKGLWCLDVGCGCWVEGRGLTMSLSWQERSAFSPASSSGSCWSCAPVLRPVLRHVRTVETAAQMAPRLPGRYIESVQSKAVQSAADDVDYVPYTVSLFLMLHIHNAGALASCSFCCAFSKHAFHTTSMLLQFVSHNGLDFGLDVWWYTLVTLCHSKVARVSLRFTWGPCGRICPLNIELCLPPGDGVHTGGEWGVLGAETCCSAASCSASRWGTDVWKVMLLKAPGYVIPSLSHNDVTLALPVVFYTRPDAALGHCYRHTMYLFTCVGQAFSMWFVSSKLFGEGGLWHIDGRQVRHARSSYLCICLSEKEPVFGPLIWGIGSSLAGVNRGHQNIASYVRAQLELQFKVLGNIKTTAMQDLQAAHFAGREAEENSHRARACICQDWAGKPSFDWQLK